MMLAVVMVVEGVYRRQISVATAKLSRLIMTSLLSSACLTRLPFLITTLGMASLQPSIWKMNGPLSG